MGKLSYYIIHVLIGLMIAQLLSVDSTIVTIIGLALLIVHSFIIFYLLKDHFLFIVYILSLCLLRTGDLLGGITLAPFLIFISYILFQGKLYVKDIFIRICLFVLVITNLLGYSVKNPSGIADITQSAVIFISLILTFIFIQNFKFTKDHFNIILKIFTSLSVLLFLVALNQKFVFVDSSFPILGAVQGYPSVGSVRFAFEGRFPSLFGDYELFSEFALLMFILSFSLFMDKKSLDYFKFGKTPFILMFFSFMNILITGTRSGFILILVFLFIFFLFRLNAFFSTKTFILFISLAILVPLFIQYGDLVGMDVIVSRLSEIDVKHLSLNSIKTGEEINRSTVYLAGYQRMSEENWLLGYGYGISQSNRMAWFGNLVVFDSSQIKDFHSLYLCIPMIYGWIGSIAYFFLLIYIIFSLLRMCSLPENNPFKGIMFGFTLLFVFFLANEIKINSLRYYNYHYLIWILMGIALATIYNKPIAEEKP